MNKNIVFMALFVLLIVSVVAQQQGSQGTDIEAKPELMGNEESGKPEDAGNEQIEGEQVAVEQNTQNQGEESQLMIQQKQQEQVQKLEQVKSMIQQKQQELAEEMEGRSEKSQNAYKNQNEVRIAVHSLLAMKEVLGGIGPQVSEIATQFDNSVKTTLQAEEKIEKKSGLARFFTGGDEKAADELASEATKNQEKIKELKQLQEQCDCAEEVKTMLQEQIQSMEQEQTRLMHIAEKEKKSKGIFGWLWK
ncbi:hypothetical protein JXB41_06440 [Candidatus Woesearchaeota archaeon]|nr:hypothetical protein [Candidatus Woesearchaeota archaeon]